jgi:hypothetical protein
VGGLRPRDQSTLRARGRWLAWSSGPLTSPLDAREAPAFALFWALKFAKAHGAEPPMNIRYLALLGFIALATSAQATPFVTIGETRFFLASASPPDSPVTREYIPAGETLEKWNQLAAVRIFKNLRDPRTFLDGLGQQSVKRNPETRYWLVQNNETKEFMVDFMAFPSSTTKPFYAEWNLWRASYVEGKGLVVYQYARRIYSLGPEFGSIVKAARDEMYNAFAAATFVEAEETKQ